MAEPNPIHNPCVYTLQPNPTLRALPLFVCWIPQWRGWRSFGGSDRYPWRNAPFFCITKTTVGRVVSRVCVSRDCGHVTVWPVEQFADFMLDDVLDVMTWSQVEIGRQVAVDQRPVTIEVITGGVRAVFEVLQRRFAQMFLSDTTNRHTHARAPYGSTQTLSTERLRLFITWSCYSAPHAHNTHAQFSYSQSHNRDLRCIDTVWVKKSSPPKTFCDIFAQVKHIYVKFCQHVISSYLHKFTNFGRFILIFNKIALIFLGVPIVFNVFSFKFHQVKSP